jgi:hypothetical protein
VLGVFFVVDFLSLVFGFVAIKRKEAPREMAVFLVLLAVVTCQVAIGGILCLEKSMIFSHIFLPMPNSLERAPAAKALRHSCAAVCWMLLPHVVVEGMLHASCMFARVYTMYVCILLLCTLHCTHCMWHVARLATPHDARCMLHAAPRVTAGPTGFGCEQTALERARHAADADRCSRALCVRRVPVQYHAHWPTL